MNDRFLGAIHPSIVACVRAVAEGAAGAPVFVRVGEARGGFRNVGVDLPRGRRSALGTRNLRIRVLRALEAAGVVTAPCALAPAVDGDLRGSVRVADTKASWGDLMPGG